MLHNCRKSSSDKWARPEKHRLGTSGGQKVVCDVIFLSADIIRAGWVTHFSRVRPRPGLANYFWARYQPPPPTTWWGGWDKTPGGQKSEEHWVLKGGGRVLMSKIQPARHTRGSVPSISGVWRCFLKVQCREQLLCNYFCPPASTCKLL